MRQAGERLDAEKADADCVRLQDEAIDLWTRMLDGLKALLGRLDEEPQGPAPRPMAGSGDQQQPLVRGVDEMRLLLGLQKDLNERFDRFRLRVKDAGIAGERQEEMTRLMADQEEIRKLGLRWRDMNYGEQR